MCVYSCQAELLHSMLLSYTMLLYGGRDVFTFYKCCFIVYMFSLPCDSLSGAPDAWKSIFSSTILGTRETTFNVIDTQSSIHTSEKVRTVLQFIFL